MKLKPRKAPHRNRVGWARLKTSPSQGWGLNRWHPTIPKWNYRNLTIAILLFLTISWFAGFYDLPNRAYATTCNDFDAHNKLLHGINQPCTTDPSTYLWRAPGCSDFNILNLPGVTLSCPRSVLRDGNTFSTMPLLSNSTNSGIALSATSIDLSTITAKQIWQLNTFTLEGGPTIGKNFGMYLTRNGTMPSIAQKNYSPLNDNSVALVFQWQLNSGPSNYLLEVLAQRVQGQTISSENVDCSPGSPGSCYVFLNVNRDAAAHWYYPEYILNYTGSTSGSTTCSPQGSGCSLIEEGASVTTSGLQVLPTFGFANGPYYVGYWVDSGASTFFDVALDVSTTPTGCTACNQMVLYQPTPTATITPPNTDTGSFLDQIWNGILNIGLFVPSVISGIPLNSLKASSNNFGSVLLAQLFQFFNYMVDFLKTILNGVGNVLGISNLGDNIFNFLNGIITMFGQLASSITNWLTSLVNRALDLITIVTTFSTTFFTGLNEFLTEMKVIATGIVTIFSKLFLYGGAFYFLYDIILYFQLTGDAGFEGVGTWIGFNKWASFAVFGLITRVINALLQGLDWIISHIPWVSPRLPETGLPAIPQLAAGEFPGLRIPSGHVQKLREGDPAAFLLWAVGGFLILPFYLGSSISPLAGLTAAVGCGPTTCFNNALTTVGYPFAGLFLLLFVGVTITEMLHGITMDGSQRIVIQNKLPPGFANFRKEATGRFQFGTKRFASLRKGTARKAAKRKEQLSPEQRYENRYGGLPGE